MDSYPFPQPANELDRVQELSSCRLLERPKQKSLALLTELATNVFSVPVALVSLIDAETQWMRAIHGADVTQMPRSTSFCTYVLMQDDPLIVLDATDDPRFASNPLVLGQPRIRFYAGAPIMGPGGHPLGSFCLIDHMPRAQFTPRELRMLKQFTCVSTEIMMEDMRRVSYVP
jgi:GAF domain-containing protein